MAPFAGLPARGHEVVSERASAATPKSAPSKSATSLPASTARIASRRSSATVSSCAKSRRPAATISLLEGQFRNLFEKAFRIKGITGDNMLNMLERRLDNVIYRMGFGTSRARRASWSATGTSR